MLVPISVLFPLYLIASSFYFSFRKAWLPMKPVLGRGKKPLKEHGVGVHPVCPSEISILLIPLLSIFLVLWVNHILLPNTLLYYSNTSEKRNLF